MENSTSAPGNFTLMFSHKGDDVIQYISVIFSLLYFTIFFCFIGIMLKVFFTTPHMQEDPRYILFVHMLINDSLYILFSNFLVVSNMHSVYFPIIFCFILSTLGGCFFLVTPYNLALMSLERYIAVCFPLRHFQFCTPKRAKYAIAGIWIIALSPCLVNFMIAMCLADRTLYSFYGLCNSTMLSISPIIGWIVILVNIVSFTMVALIIVFTYINVMLVVRRISSSRSSALKAGKTIILHAFQLLLCLVVFISTVSGIFVTNHTNLLLFTHYVLFTCLPRFLSPLIYGVRDEVFQKHIRNYSTISCVCRPQLGLEKL